MRSTGVFAAAVFAALCAAWCAGCGGGKPMPDSGPFAAAIDEYLKTNSMDMRVDSFDSLAISGDTATAKVRMADKDVGYGMRVVWEFTFEKAGDKWVVKDRK